MRTNAMLLTPAPSRTIVHGYVHWLCTGMFTSCYESAAIVGARTVFGRDARELQKPSTEQVSDQSGESGLALVPKPALVL